MANELIITTKQFTNPKLNEATQAVNTLLTAIGRAKNETAVKLSHIFHTVDAEESYKADGFESTVDFIKKTFGASESNAYAYIQVGRALHNGLPDKDANGETFNFTQLRAMLPAFNKKPEALKEAITDGDITEAMTEKAVKEKVQAVKGGKTRPTAGPKKYRFCHTGVVKKDDGSRALEIIEDGEHTLEAFATDHKEIDGFSLYTAFAVDGLHHFLYVNDSGLPAIMVKAYSIPKPPKPTKAG